VREGGVGVGWCWEADHGRKLGGRKPFAPDPDGLSKRTINTTDPDSRVITRTGRPAVRGYNAQAVTNTGQIIIAADITQRSNDSGQLEPMIRQAVATLEDAGVSTPIGTLLADGGYWNSPQMRALGQDGITTIIPTKAAHRTQAQSYPPSRDPRLSESTRSSRPPRAPRSADVDYR
jgi:Transposase DDE domain